MATSTSRWLPLTPSRTQQPPNTEVRELHAQVVQRYCGAGSDGYSEEHVREIMRMALRGIEAVHDEGILHRDLKVTRGPSPLARAQTPAKVSTPWQRLDPLWADATPFGLTACDRLVPRDHQPENVLLVDRRGGLTHEEFDASAMRCMQYKKMLGFEGNPNDGQPSSVPLHMR